MKRKVLPLIFLCTLAMCAFSFGENPLTKEFKTAYNFSVYLTDEWREVPSDILGNLESAGLPHNFQYAYHLKYSQKSLGYTYIYVSFFEGRVSQQTFRSKFANRKTVEEGINESLKQDSSVKYSGTRLYDFTYNQVTHSADYLIESTVPGRGMMECYTALQLTQTGVIQFRGYTSYVEKDEYLPFFKKAAESLKLQESAVFKPRFLEDRHRLKAFLIFGVPMLIVAFFVAWYFFKRYVGKKKRRRSSRRRRRLPSDTSQQDSPSEVATQDSQDSPPKREPVE